MEKLLEQIVKKHRTDCKKHRTQNIIPNYSK